MSLSSILSTIQNSAAYKWIAEHSPLGNSVGLQILLFSIVILFGVGYCTYAKADEPSAPSYQAQIEILGGSTVVRGPTGAMGLNLIFPKMIGGWGNIEGGFNIVGESSFNCPNNTECNNNQAVVHLEAVAPIPWFGELGIGVAHIQHADNFNSGSINFSLSYEHHVWRNVYFRYQHFSCAGTSSPNEGRDIAMVGWRF